MAINPGLINTGDPGMPAGANGHERDLPGCPVVKTLPSKAGGAGSILGWGAKISQAKQCGEKEKPALAQPGGERTGFWRRPEHQATNPAAKVLHEASLAL